MNSIIGFRWYEFYFQYIGGHPDLCGFFYLKTISSGATSEIWSISGWSIQYKELRNKVSVQWLNCNKNWKKYDIAYIYLKHTIDQFISIWRDSQKLCLKYVQMSL